MDYTQTRTQELDQAKPQTARRRFLPALALFFLSPLIGEFLLGNLPITWLWALISLAPLYGAGALLIRETTRRLGWGWPSMVVLGLVYAVIEEAFVTQSLFNPNYVGLRLLDYGYISSLGISAWWTVFVLSIHTIWSTAVPIALVESFTPETRRTPWLGPVGLVITVLLFLAGCVMTFVFQQQGDPFMASTMQFVVSGVVVVILVAIAFAFGRARPETQTDAQTAPSVWMAGGMMFVLGSVYMAVINMPETVPAFLTVLVMLALLAAISLLVWRWSSRAGWSELHRLAVAGGLLLVYVWYSFVQVPSVEGTSPMVDAIGNAVFGIGALALLFIAWRRVSQERTRAEHASLRV